MSNTEEKVFADGFSFKRSDNAPDFVIGRLSLKIDEAIVFINKHNKRGWLNLNVKKSRGGAYYVELDTFEPTQTQAQTQKVTPPNEGWAPTENNDALPF